MERIPQPIMDKRGEPHMRRFQEQRWAIDNIKLEAGGDACRAQQQVDTIFKNGFDGS